MSIVDVQVTATDTAVITFDGDPDWNGFPADGNFLVNGVGFQTVAELTPTTYELVQPFGQPPITPGDLWDLTAQLLWANNPVVNPANGTTT